MKNVLHDAKKTAIFYKTILQSQNFMIQLQLVIFETSCFSSSSSNIILPRFIRFPQNIKSNEQYLIKGKVDEVM